MGLFKKLFKKETPQQTKLAELMNGYAPIFTQFGQDIYASDVVQQAINCIASEIKKLMPEHDKKINGRDLEPVDDDLQKVLNNPNPNMTTSDFLEKVIWLLFLNYNAFIIPVYYEWEENGSVKRKYEALYPILPTQVDFIEDAANRLFVKFRFSGGDEYTVKYSDIIHIKYRYSVNEYMGGNEFGQPDNDALLKTLELNHQLLEGVAKAMKSSYALNGVVRYQTMMDDGKTEAALKDLENKIKNSESGFLPLDLKAEFMPLNKNISMVDKDTLEFIDSKILRHYGVSLPILTGDYTKEQYEAFYQKTLEPLIISISQAFTKVLFTDRQRSIGHCVMLYTKDLIFMSTDQKIQMVKELAPTGGIFENEKRVMFGMRPLKELTGKRYVSLNWIDADIANDYQMNNKNKNNNGGDNVGE